MGASALNISPSFPAPIHLLPQFDRAFDGQPRPRLPGILSEEWLAAFPFHSELVSIFDDLCALTVMVERESLQSQPVQDPKFTGFYIIPLVHRLFTLQSDPNETLQGNMIFESSKMSAFMYLQQLRHFVALRYPCLKEPFFEHSDKTNATLAYSCVQKLGDSMVGHGDIWTELQSLKCWALTIATNTSYFLPELPVQVFDLAMMANSPSYSDWCASMGPLAKNPWTQVLFTSQLIHDAEEDFTHSP